jgi:hypothetical protein
MSTRKSIEAKLCRHMLGLIEDLRGGKETPQSAMVSVKAAHNVTTVLRLRDERQRFIAGQRVATKDTLRIIIEKK